MYPALCCGMGIYFHYMFVFFFFFVDRPKYNILKEKNLTKRGTHNILEWQIFASFDEFLG